MVIDSHVHLKHGDAAKTEYSPETIVEVMDGARIDKSIVFAMSTNTRNSIKMAKEAVGKFPDRLIPYAYAIPSYDTVVVELIEEAVTEFGFRGIKIHMGECTLADYVSDPLMKLAGKLGVPCLIDCLGRNGDMERIAGKFPQTKIIIAHLGRYLCQDAELINRFISLAEAHDNVLLDTSGVVIPSKIKEAVDRVGSARIFFGTDGPDKKPDVVTHARSELDKIRALNLGADDESAVLGGSIAGLLGIS